MRRLRELRPRSLVVPAGSLGGRGAPDWREASWLRAWRCGIFSRVVVVPQGTGLASRRRGRLPSRLTFGAGPCGLVVSSVRAAGAFLPMVAIVACPPTRSTLFAVSIADEDKKKEHAGLGGADCLWRLDGETRKKGRALQRLKDKGRALQRPRRKGRALQRSRDKRESFAKIKGECAVYAVTMADQDSNDEHAVRKRGQT